MKNMKPELSRRLTLLGAMLLSSSVGYAQTTAPAAKPAAAEEDEKEVMVLSPFEVSADEDQGYSAESTLAGNRLSTELRDIGNAVSVINSQFLRDVQATSNETLLQYTTGTEVGNIRGNFAGLGDGAVLDESTRFQRPSQNTRVRGLAEADNTRDYFLSDIPWDSYNVDRVDLQRGPNSIIFGLGSPAGLLNTTTKQASFKDSNEVSYRIDNWGSNRVTGDFNKVIISKELAVRLAVLGNKEKYQQEPAFADDKRIYGAIRWEPAFLRKGGSRTILKANFENGNVDSNRPRSVPPLDRITPWFKTGTYNGSFKQTGTYRDPATGNPVSSSQTGSIGQPTVFKTRIFKNLNRETFNPFQVQDDNTGRPNHGQQRPVINGGTDAGYINTAFNPWVGNFAQQFAGVNAFYANGDTATPGSNFVWEGSRARGLNSLGNIDGDLGRAFHRPVGIARYDQFAANAGLPYYQFGLYKAVSLTDSSVFNFYDNLIDGPNKNEWNDWNAYNVNLAQTFMDDKFGFQVEIQREDFTRGQNALLSGDKQAIYIDINSVYSDGTPAGSGGEPFQDGTVNPNVGRAFLSDSGQGGNTEQINERDSLRVTAFFTHDFGKNRKNVFTRILGKHTFTGLYSDDNVKSDNRSWMRYGISDNGYLNFIGNSSYAFNANELAINRVIYLGPKLTSAAGANLPTPTAIASVPSSLTVRAFDSTWNAPSVNPADAWINEYYPVGHASRNSTQSENPLNYRGFVNTTVNVLDSEKDTATRNLMTSNAQLSKTNVISKAVVWQGFLWDKSIVGTFGYRRDDFKFFGKTLNTNSGTYPRRLDLSSTNYVLPTTGLSGGGISRSYSIVTHVNQLPFVAKLAERLPVEVTFFYNKSSNFQPAAGRVDVYGVALNPPSGKTIDRGVLLETKDGKYSLKVNYFVTSLKDAGSSALTNSWYIGSGQAWAGNWANRFQYDLAHTSNNNMTINYQANNRPVGAPNPAGYSPTVRAGNSEFDATNSLYNYGQDVGETRAQADAREAAAVNAWRTWQASVDPRFYAAWGINLNAPFATSGQSVITAATPQNFTITEDSVSKGYEIEFNANPTKNWRLTFNATKVEAIRSNVGGTNLIAFITAYEKALTTTAAGDLRIWWGGAGNDTTFRQWFQNADSQVGSDWAQKALAEGTRVSELRKWRFNAISNYNFTEGRLKGFRFGGALRWQDKIALGNRPVGDPLGAKIAFDLANPYYGSSEMYMDAWIGYGRRLPMKLFSRNIDWDIQLNVTNIGQGNDLIPVTVQPDGSVATYRIAPHQYLTLTNSFKF